MLDRVEGRSSCWPQESDFSQIEQSACNSSCWLNNLFGDGERLSIYRTHQNVIKVNSLVSSASENLQSLALKVMPLFDVMSFPQKAGFRTASASSSDEIHQSLGAI